MLKIITANHGVRAQLRTRTGLRTLTTTPPTRANFSFSDLEHEMKTRKISPIFDDLSPHSHFRLEASLADYLPDTPAPCVLPSPSADPAVLPIAHHLVYFEPTKPASTMLPDGTNPDQSPGKPFVRRMWAGGRVLYDPARPLVLDARRAVCAEFIRGITTTGVAGNEKVYVRIERRLAVATADEAQRCAAAAVDPAARADLAHRVRQRLWRDAEDAFGPCSVLETRSLVFLRARDERARETDRARVHAPAKTLRPAHAPSWTHTLTPDAKLLFRFSALTFNAHAIHLDPAYCREVEGHRERLVHGPLAYVLMLRLLQRHLRRAGREGGDGTDEVVREVEYRNLAPLYCNEPMAVCGARTAEHRWEIWTQTPAGGVAVKGSVVTESRRAD